MASKDINDLIKEVKEKAIFVKEYCKNEGIDLLIYCTYRSFKEQAKLYRQSRPLRVIENKAKRYREQGLDFLADILLSVGPCFGPHVTNAGPGSSWHNYGMAWDAVPLINGKPLWRARNKNEVLFDEWRIYSEAVKKSGMYWSGDWIRFKEYPHAQLYNSTPTRMFDKEKIKSFI